MEAPKKWAVMPWKHTQQPQFHQQTLLAKKTQRFLEIQQLPKGPGAFWKDTLFFPRGFLLNGFFV